MPRKTGSSKKTATANATAVAAADQTQTQAQSQSQDQVKAELELLPIPAISKTAIVKARVAAITITQEVVVLAGALVVSTPEDFHNADALLGKIMDAKRNAELPVRHIIDQVRPGLDRLYAINREIQNPLIDVEKIVKEKMRVYKIEELRLAREREILEAEKRRQAQLQAVQEQQQVAVVETANTHPIGCTCGYCDGRGSVVQTVTMHIEPATQMTYEPPIPFITGLSLIPPLYEPPIPFITGLSLIPPPQPVTGSHSTSRTIKKWRVVDLPLVLQAVILGMIPIDVIGVNATEVNARFSSDLDKQQVAMWPGFEVVDDVQIAGR